MRRVGGRNFGVEHAQRADDDLLGRESRKQGHAGLPVESQRAEDRLAPFAEASEVGIFVVRFAPGGLLRAGIVTQEPYDDGCHEDHAAHLLEILRAFVPHVREGRLPRRQAVGRELHDEGRLVDRELEAPHQARRHHGQHDPQQVEARHHRSGVCREEGPGDEQVDRNARAARHEGRDEDGNQTAAAALDRPAGHDRRDVAPEAHNQRDERFPVQSDAVHHAVHDEGRAREVSRILHEGDEQVEDHDVRKEDDDRSHAADHAVDQQVAQRPRGEQRVGR